MNIVLVAPFRLASTGGIVTVMQRLQQGLYRQGHKVLSILAGDSDSVRPIHRADWPDTYGMYLRVPSIRHTRGRGVLAFCVYLPISLYFLTRFLREENIDLVHLHFPAASLFYFALLRPFARWKLVVSLHGNDINKLGAQSWSFQWLVKFILARADVIAPCSHSLLNKLVTISEEYRIKSVCIPNANPLSPEMTSFPVINHSLPDRFILSVGSLIHRKGHDILIRAIRLAKDRGFPLHLVIVGGGPENASLCALARDLGVSELIQFTGDVKHEAISTYYRWCSYVVLATRAEGMPLTLLEAMAFKKAVIATSVDGIPEIVRDGDTGLLVPPEDVEALTTAILRLDQDSTLRIGLAERAYAFVLQKHTWERYLERTLQAYYRACTGGMSG